MSLSFLSISVLFLIFIALHLQEFHHSYGLFWYRLCVCSGLVVFNLVFIDMTYDDSRSGQYVTIYHICGIYRDMSPQHLFMLGLRDKI